MNTDYHCPCCGKALCIDIVPDGVLVYCGYGPCKDNRMNDGVEAPTAAQAVEWLQMLHTVEMGAEPPNDGHELPRREKP